MNARKNRPGQASRAAIKSTATDYSEYIQSSSFHEPVTLEDRLDAQVLAAAAERGYRLASRCLDCGHFLVAERSVRAHRGPKCRAKRADGAVA